VNFTLEPRKQVTKHDTYALHSTEFAVITGFSRAMVAKWLDEGMPAECTGNKGAKVTINPSAAMQWLIDKERKRQMPESDLAAERLRLITEQAVHPTLDNAKTRSELILLWQWQKRGRSLARGRQVRK
jgi:phage terminase Nu1 subunit (DNA packaging protein)